MRFSFFYLLNIDKTFKKCYNNLILQKILQHNVDYVVKIKPNKNRRTVGEKSFHKRIRGFWGT